MVCASASFRCLRSRERPIHLTAVTSCRFTSLSRSYAGTTRVCCVCVCIDSVLVLKTTTADFDIYNLNCYYYSNDYVTILPRLFKKNAQKQLETRVCVKNLTWMRVSFSILMLFFSFYVCVCVWLLFTFPFLCKYFPFFLFYLSAALRPVATESFWIVKKKLKEFIQ